LILARRVGVKRLWIADRKPQEEKTQQGGTGEQTIGRSTRDLPFGEGSRRYMSCLDFIESLFDSMVVRKKLKLAAKHMMGMVKMFVNIYTEFSSPKPVSTTSQI